MATALAVRDRIVDRWHDSARADHRAGGKRVYYFSLEFLIGRMLVDAMSQPGPHVDRARGARRSSASTSSASAGWSPTPRSATAAWAGWPRASWKAWRRWGFPRTATASATTTASSGRSSRTAGSMKCRRSGWRSATRGSSSGRGSCTPSGSAAAWRKSCTRRDARHVWLPSESVNAVAFDTPITGWRGRHVNTLRLWSARAADPISLDDFNRGDHVGALADRVRLEAISRVLYPSDETPAGADLRLRQEFFFASASLQDLVRRHKQQHGELSSLPDHAAIQLNDTHPAIAVPELMRLLVDEHGMPWDLAWRITTAVFNYTNHTLLPEALETWPVPLLERMLPRHMQIIERNQRAPSRRAAQARRARRSPAS